MRQCRSSARSHIHAGRPPSRLDRQPARTSPEQSAPRIAVDDQWRRHQPPRHSELMQRGGRAGRGRDQRETRPSPDGPQPPRRLAPWTRSMPSSRSRRTTRSAAARPRSFTRDPPRPAQTAMDPVSHPGRSRFSTSSTLPPQIRQIVPAPFLRHANCRSTGAGAPVVLCRSGRMLMLAAPEVLPTLTVPGISHGRHLWL
jgi:hypothetical protein